MSATLAAVARTVWTIPRLSAPMCSFIPKCQLRPLRVCFISGSRAALAFLVELGAAMMVASTMVLEACDVASALVTLRSVNVLSDEGGILDLLTMIRRRFH